MMKKISLLMIMMISTILLFNQTVSAETVFIDEPSANVGGLWHEEVGNRAYVYMRYTYDETVIETGNFPAGVKDYLTPNLENDYSLYTYWPDYLQEDLNFPNTSTPKTATISNPDASVYDTFKVEIITSMTSEYSGRVTEFKEIESYDSVVDTIRIELYDKDQLPCANDYSFLRLLVDGDEVLSSRQLSEQKADVCIENAGMGPLWGPSPTGNPNYYDLAFGVRMYWEKSETAGEIDPGTSTSSWESLPDTTGSPVNPIGDWGTVSNINVDNQTVSFDINYQGTLYPVADFTVAGDLDFIDNSNDVLYYSDPSTDDRILYFNFGDTLDSAILTARTFTNINIWKGEALWNLTQNEIKVTDVLTVYNYIPEVDDDGNVYSYFYMPDVPIDNLISVSAILAYRYWDDGFLNIGPLEPGEIQYKTVAAVRGETSSVNPNWVETTYKGAYIFGTVAAVATATVGFIPVYGWGVAGAAFLVGGVLQVSDINEWFAYDVQQIQHVIPSVALATEINSYIAETSGEDSFTADTDKLYKLHLATLQDHDDVQIMGDLSNVTQVVWETDGEIYVINEENIDNPDWGGQGTLIPQDDIGNDDLEMIFYALVAIFAVLIISKFKLLDKPFLMILIIGGVVYILYDMGVF